MSQHNQDTELLLSIVVPAFNEAENLPACLAALRETFPGTPCEVLVIDDGSADATRAVAQRLAADWPGRVRVHAHENNQGLGAVLKTGFQLARGRYVTVCPADFEMTPIDWQPFSERLGHADVLVGCRRQRAGYNPLMRFNAWLYPQIVARMFALRLRDVNWICVYRRSLIERVAITQKGIPMLTEILVKLRDLGATFLEIECQMQPRRHGVPSAARPRVMWRTLKGLLGLWWAYRLLPVLSHARIGR